MRLKPGSQDSGTTPAERRAAAAMKPIRNSGTSLRHGNGLRIDAVEPSYVPSDAASSARAARFSRRILSATSVSTIGIRVSDRVSFTTIA